MSGPKVINLEAIRRQQQRNSLARLRDLEDLVAEWREAMQQAGLMTDELAAETGAMFGKLENLRQGEQWQAMLAELPARLEFFRSGIATAREAGIKRKAFGLERRRRLQFAASTLQREWTAPGNPAPAELEEVLRAGMIEDEAELSRLESIVQAAFCKLPAVEAPKPGSERQRELANALRSESSTPDTFQEWLATSSGEDAAQKVRGERLDRALAELELHAPPELAAPLFEKARLIAKEPSAERRVMLTDSLLLEADELCKGVREREQTKRQVREAIAGLVAFQSAEADAWRQRLTAALDNPSTIAVQELLAAAETWRAAEVVREEAALRREAVLRALGSLGYEVREGMATAWAENGRIVVRKPSDPNYGIELASPPAGAAVQARVVAFDVPGRSSQSAQRDLEVEQTWCSEFERARQSMTADGFSPWLLHATPVGEVPLKVVPQIEGEQRRGVEASKRVRKVGE